MADVTLVRSGRWGLTRAVQEADGGWTTYAAQQRLAPKVEHHWPPQLADGTPVVNAVLVRLVGPVTLPSDENTQLFPRDLADLADVTMGELPTAQRNRLRTFLESWLLGYSFLDFDGQARIVEAFSARTATYTNATTFREILRDIYRHLYHSTDRPRQIVPESHNTEYTDDFSTDPFAVGTERWTVEAGAAVWDSTNSELDCSLATANSGVRYSVNGAGSIEHEAQATFVVGTTGQFPGVGGGAVRFDTSGTDDWYYIGLDPAVDGDVDLYRLNAGTRTLLATFTAAISVSVADFLTSRLSAEGAAGANVVLNLWLQNHGSTKPSDPGWIGVDGSPDETYTDTAAGRLDDTGHGHCGIAYRGYGNDYDTRHCFFKLRAISDRSGGAGRTTKNTRPYPLGIALGINRGIGGL